MPKMLPVRDVTAPVCCSPIASDAMDEETAIGVALRLRALADPVRLRLLSLILTTPQGEACNCDLASVVGVTDATVSHHLKALREAGLIVGEKRGTWIYYRPVRPALGALCRVIDPDCC
jgi:ArsR family transcriptional regulator